MTNDGDLPLPERSEVERRLQQLERDVNLLALSTAQLHTMQAYADRDIAEWRQNFVRQNRVINALRQTQVEHSARFDRVEQRLDRLGDRLEGRLDGKDLNTIHRVVIFTPSLISLSGNPGKPTLKDCKLRCL